jgi:hypothetical protein
MGETMNLSDNEKRMLALLARGPGYIAKDHPQRKSWGRLMGKLCALGYAHPFHDVPLGEAYVLTVAGRDAYKLRLREAFLMRAACREKSVFANEPEDRQRWDRSAQIWLDEYILLGGTP